MQQSVGPWCVYFDGINGRPAYVGPLQSNVFSIIWVVVYNNVLNDIQDDSTRRIIIIILKTSPFLIQFYSDRNVLGIFYILNVKLNKWILIFFDLNRIKKDNNWETDHFCHFDSSISIYQLFTSTNQLKTSKSWKKLKM